jgi:hypothetical protein
MDIPLLPIRGNDRILNSGFWVISGGRDEALQPHHPFTADTLQRLYLRHGSTAVFMPFLPWYADCASRLRRGLEPTAADHHQRATLQARLRIAIP